MDGGQVPARVLRWGANVEDDDLSSEIRARKPLCGDCLGVLGSEVCGAGALGAVAQGVASQVVPEAGDVVGDEGVVGP